MSMLAEPRRKQKWSVDPRNSAWSKDDSKFGQKMLERMGWSKGKGLGKSEQGATEHIKVKVKNNSLGLGTTISNEDNWIAHQDDFNQLLAELNNCHGQSNTEEPSSEQTQSFSLEEKSKTSKKRVHYMKFTKGKDLSSRSETDLACIFGKRAKQMKNQDEASNGTDSQEEEEQDSDDKDSPSNSEVKVNTVTSALTMQEYFAQRMARLKNSRAEISSSTSAIETSGNPQSQSTDSPNTSDMNESGQKKRKKKKSRKVDHDNEEKVEENENAPVTEEVTAVEQADSDSKKKKKKKKKEQDGEKDLIEECCVPAAKQDTTGDIEFFPTDKKKKRKNKLTPTHTPTDSTKEDDKANIITGGEVSDKKKRKQREHEEEQTEIVDKKKSKKDKKKKKNYN